MQIIFSHHPQHLDIIFTSKFPNLHEHTTSKDYSKIQAKYLKMPTSTIHPGSSISSRSGNHHSSSGNRSSSRHCSFSGHHSSSGHSGAPSYASSHRSSSSHHFPSSHISSGSAATSASRSKEFIQMVKYEGDDDSDSDNNCSSHTTVSRSSSNRSYDPTVHPASSSGRAHSEVSNNKAMVPYTGNSSSNRTLSSYVSRNSPHRSSSSCSRSHSGSRSGSHYSSSPNGRELARRDDRYLDRIDEEPPKTLKDASVSELLDECDKKLGKPKYEHVRIVPVPVYVPYYSGW